MTKAVGGASRRLFLSVSKGAGVGWDGRTGARMSCRGRCPRGSRDANCSAKSPLAIRTTALLHNGTGETPYNPYRTALWIRLRFAALMFSYKPGKQEFHFCYKATWIFIERKLDLNNPGAMMAPAWTLKFLFHVPFSLSLSVSSLVSNSWH